MDALNKLTQVTPINMEKGQIQRPEVMNLKADRPREQRKWCLGYEPQDHKRAGVGMGNHRKAVSQSPFMLLSFFT
jgi:hypothetical protein